MTLVTGVFFRQLDDDLFDSTPWTRGPWSAVHQHAGPPSALVAGRLAETLDDGFRVVRVAVEVTRPVPIAPLRLRRSVRRDGRTAKAIVGELFDPDGKRVLSADVLALAEVPLGLDLEPASIDEPGPEESLPVAFPFHDGEASYSAAMELRLGRGAFGSGDVMAWMRMRIPLLEGRAPTSLERTMSAADSGNGVSQRVSWDDYTFTNPDLAVTLHRPLRGEWVGMAARTDMDARGIGVADTRLYDADGPIGRGMQTLLVRRRG